MNALTPTPRTDAAVKLTCGKGHNTVCPNFARELERELTALTAERDQLRAEFEKLAITTAQAQDRNVSHRLERDKAEAERTDAIYQRACEVERELRAEVENEAKWAAHYLAESIAVKAERDHLHAQLHALTLICGTNDANKFETWIDRANARAERAEAAETVALAHWNKELERAMKAEAELAAAKERLRSEAMDDYASIKDLQRELAIERARLNWLETPSGMDWQWEPERLTVSRASIDAAMTEEAK